MKKYLIYTLTTYCSILNLFAQSSDDHEEPVGYIDPTYSINWSDPIYKNLFTSSCQGTLKSKVQRNLNTIYDQCNQTWSFDKKNTYGNSCTGCKDFHTSYPDVVDDDNCYICDYGCAVTCLAMILNDQGFSDDPGSFNTWLKNNNGYTCSNKGCSKYCSVDWNGIYNYTKAKNPELHVSLHSCNDIVLNSLDKIKTIIDSKGYVIIKACQKTKTIPCYHNILIYDYDNEGTAQNDFIISDPGTSADDAQRTSLKDYIFCTDPPDSRSPVWVAVLPKRVTPEIISSGTTTSSGNLSIPAGTSIKLKFKMLGEKKKEGIIPCNIIWVVTNINTGERMTSSVSEPSFTFTSSGDYSVSIAISDANGIDATLYDGTITVTEGDAVTADNSDWSQAFTIDFSTGLYTGSYSHILNFNISNDQSNGVAPNVKVKFKASCDNASGNVTYVWRINENQNDLTSICTPDNKTCFSDVTYNNNYTSNTYEFSTSGLYRITVTATDNAGNYGYKDYYLNVVNNSCVMAFFANTTASQEAYTYQLNSKLVMTEDVTTNIYSNQTDCADHSYVKKIAWSLTKDGVEKFNRSYEYQVSDYPNISQYCNGYYCYDECPVRVCYRQRNNPGVFNLDQVGEQIIKLYAYAGAFQLYGDCYNFIYDSEINSTVISKKINVIDCNTTKVVLVQATLDAYNSNAQYGDVYISPLLPDLLSINLNSGSSLNITAYHSIDLTRSFNILKGSNFDAKVVPCPGIKCNDNPNDPTYSCTKSATFPLNNYVDINNINDLNSNISVFPNPTSDFLHILINNNNLSISNVSIYNCLGKNVYTSNKVSKEFLIDTRSYSKGVYIIKLTGNAFVSSYKIVFN